MVNDKSSFFRYSIAAFLALVLAAGTVRAQQTSSPVPRIEAAEQVFQEGLEAFEAGTFGLAHRRFRDVVRQHPLNRKTTAAALMAGKALYRTGEYARAEEQMTGFLEEYPSSSYVEEARRVRRFARQRLGQSGQTARPPLQLGIALPMAESDRPLVQAMFNGIRLAVEEHNQAEGTNIRPARMVFRGSGGAPDTARRALAALTEAGVDAVIGPLYSREAREAGAVAEETRTPMIAPLATDAGVSQGRRYVFQANPTIAMRGRVMAQFSQQSLLLDTLGIVRQPEGTLSYRMAESFREEALARGVTIYFAKTLPDVRAWGNLEEQIGTDTLAAPAAIYMPVSGRQAPRLIQRALSSLDRTNLQTRVLGNAEWHDQPLEQRASRYRVTYSNDFHVDADDSQVQAFASRYREAFGVAPDQLSVTGRRLAYTGYDVARFLLRARDRRPDQPLQEVLRAAPQYQGLGIRIDFRGGNVNRAMFFHQYKNGQVNLLR